MKLEIYKEIEKAPLEVTPIKLALKTAPSGGVSLVAVNDDGSVLESGYLLKITKDGCIRLNSGIDDRFGFSLDSDRCLQITAHRG